MNTRNFSLPQLQNLPIEEARIVADALQQLAHMAAATPQRAVEQAAQCLRQVVAGVAIGHREHIDAVELVAVGNDPPGPGNQGAAQGGGGEEFGFGGPYGQGWCGHDPECGAGQRLNHAAPQQLRARRHPG